MFCGIDVGLRKSIVAVIDEGVVFTGKYEDADLSDVKAAGIDAPLSLPREGTLRECERLLLKMGIRLFPSGAPFFRKIVLRGMEIADELRKKGIEVFEVYPYATRVILNIAPGEKKQRKEGLKKIADSLSRFVKVEGLTHDEVDAVIAALTVKMYYEGRAVILRGEDGEILVPKGEVQQSLVEWWQD